MTASTQVRLTVITASPNDAERIESHLRNAGHVVHAEWIADVDHLDPRLPTSDLVLCASENLAKASLSDVIEKCNRATRRVLVIGMAETIDVARTTQAMRAGARDLVSLKQMEHLQAVVLRELEHIELRRNFYEVNARLQQVEKRHDNLLQESAEALAYVQEGIHIRVNPAYAKLFGFSDVKSVEGLPLMDLVVIEDRPLLKQRMRLVARGQQDKTPQAFRGLNIDGSHLPIHVRFTQTRIDDEDCIEVMIIPEQTAPVAEAESVPAAAPEPAAPSAPAVPSYTGGSGRQSLYVALDQALKDADQQTGVSASLFVRVDNIDRLEQRLGFDLTDQIFNELAAFMLQCCSANEHSFRFSSSEFVVLTSRDDTKQLEQLANELRSSIAGQSFGSDAQSASLTVSIAILPLSRYSNTQDILREARQQVASVQNRMGSGVHIEAEREQGDSPQQQDKEWITRIKTALEQNHFKLVYKSIVNLEGENSHYFDALLRMLSDSGEEIHALDFLPIAERHGLTLPIDQWVIQQALLSINTRQRADQEYGLFVRLSDNSIGAADKLVPWLLKQIKGYPVRPEGLVLTFSETGLLDNIAKAKQLFSDLKKIKLRTAISHFGVSPQALQLLEQLPVDFVRLDVGVIKALANPKAGDRVSDTLKQARQKGVRIVAKQVTDAQTMAMLWTLGVHFIEGDYTQEPDAVSPQTA